MFLLILAALFQSCDKENDKPILLKSQISISLTHEIAGETLVFDTIQYINAAGNPYSVSTLKYFISDLKLHRKDGTIAQLRAVQYVDARDENTTSFLADQEILAGEYERITFTFGLDSLQNQPGNFPNPPENLMEWPPTLGSGYHYMKLEGKLDSAGMVKNYQAHSGPSRGNHYYFNVELAGSGFTLKEGEQTVELIMDINKWWTEPNLLDLNDMTMVMGNLDMQQKIMENGANVFSFGGVTDR